MPTLRLQLGIPGLSSGEALEYYGPTLQVNVRRHDFDSSIDAEINSGIPDMLYPALIDTGSRETAIDSTLAAELGLAVEDTERQAAGILGLGAVNVYLAQVAIPELGLSATGRFPGVHLATGGQPYRALIGRDILRGFTMLYEGRTGVVTLSND